MIEIKKTTTLTILITKWEFRPLTSLKNHKPQFNRT